MVLQKYHSLVGEAQRTFDANFDSLYVSGKLLTHPYPKPTFFPKWKVSVNVRLGKG